MAEIGAIASVAGLLSLAIQVVDASHLYFSSVRNASRTIKSYFRELELFRIVLEEFSNVLNDEAAACLVSLPGSNVLDACFAELGAVALKLEKRLNNPGNAFQ